MGTVYKGHHRDLDLDVAIKFLHSQLLGRPEASGRFFREARLAARINDPGIVRVFDCGNTAGHYYIVMEFVDGQSLADHIAERGSLPVARALKIVEAIARSLDHAWQEVGLIHRDIKPANILLTSSGQPKLADLGLAKSLAAEIMSTAHTAAGTAIGTPNYMPPEQFADASRTDHRGDIFSLGATLYHSLSGRPPFDASTFFAILKQIEESDPSPLPTHVPMEVEELVARMMAKRPEERFQTYSELIKAVQLAQNSLGDTEEYIQQVVDSPTVSIPEARVAGRMLRAATPIENRVLLVVDVQNDFCPNGALAVPPGTRSSQ